jgi:hypothetical protein
LTSIADDRLGVADGPGDHLRRQSPDRTAPAVDQAGLPGQGFTVPDYPDDVPGPSPQTTGRQDDDLADVPEHLGDVPAEPTGALTGIELGFDDDPAGDDVQPPGEAQGGRHLGLAAAGLGHLQTAELVLDHRRHRHRNLLPVLVPRPGPFVVSSLR